MQRRERVIHTQQPADIRHSAMHHRAGRAPGQSIGDEIVAVTGLATQGHEQIARLQRPRIDRNAGRGKRRSHRAASRLQQIVRGPQYGS